MVSDVCLLSRKFLQLCVDIFENQVTVFPNRTGLYSLSLFTILPTSGPIGTNHMKQSGEVRS